MDHSRKKIDNFLSMALLPDVAGKEFAAALTSAGMKSVTSEYFKT